MISLFDDSESLPSALRIFRSWSIFVNFCLAHENDTFFVYLLSLSCPNLGKGRGIWVDVDQKERNSATVCKYVFKKKKSIQADVMKMSSRHRSRKGLESEWIYQNADILNKTGHCSCIQKLSSQSLLGTFSSLHNVIKFKPDEFKFIPKTLLATWSHAVKRLKK